MNVVIVGIGPGNPEIFTGQACSAIKDADVVLSSLKRVDGIRELNDNVKILGVMDTVDYINNNKDRDMTVAVAASGDTGFYSIASTIKRRADEGIEISFIPGISSMLYFHAKITESYGDTVLVSLHGNDKSIIPYVCYNQKVFALSGGTVKAHNIVRELVDAGLGDCCQVYIGENLSFDNERIVKGTPEELKDLEFEDLAVVFIRNNNYVNKYKTLKDDDFVRGDSPMTKEAVRNLSLSALEIEPGDKVYDIGAGTGSVTCAMAYKACESFVYAIEKNESAVELVRKNMEETGARNIKVVCGKAPSGMEDFPAPDKVFIGGSTGEMGNIVDLCLEKNPDAVFVANAITLETIAQTIQVFKDRNMDTEVSCVNVSVAHKLGRYNLMKAENPIYIIKGVRKNEEE